MLTKEWLEKEIKYLNQLEEEAVERLENATARVEEAKCEQHDAEEHRYSIRACIEEWEWHLEQFDNPEKTEYNGEGR